ncbi:hypothetical protein LEP1GSC080_0188 [Leptospira interrogans str. FPW2026]|nr:hypothetical protein LEP1GSC080_0188 [Leptospira interrogans str. FPW2026]
MNKILFFGKVVVPTFYPFARFMFCAKQFGLKQDLLFV